LISSRFPGQSLEVDFDLLHQIPACIGLTGRKIFLLAFSAAEDEIQVLMQSEMRVEHSDCSALSLMPRRRRETHFSNAACVSHRLANVWISKQSGFQHPQIGL